LTRKKHGEVEVEEDSSVDEADENPDKGTRIGNGA